MKTSIFIVAALALVSAGCTSVRVGPDQTLDIGTRAITIVGAGGFRASAVTRPDPHQPNVFIANGKIVIDQEPVRPTRELPGGGYLVTWALDSAGGHSFPTDNAITFGAGAPTVRCRRGATNLIIGCLFPKPVTLPAMWKYAITVKNDATGRIQTLDPSMEMD